MNKNADWVYAVIFGGFRKVLSTTEIVKCMSENKESNRGDFFVVVSSKQYSKQQTGSKWDCSAMIIDDFRGLFTVYETVLYYFILLLCPLGLFNHKQLSVMQHKK